MKILYHHRTLGDGAEGIHIQEMVTSLRELGHEVRVMSLIGEKTNAATQRTNFWRRVSGLMPATLYEVAEIMYNVVWSRQLLRAIRRFEPDLIYDRYNSYNAAALQAAKQSGVPILLEVNAPVTLERTVYERLKLKLPRLARHYERKICSGADCIFAVSTPLKDYLVREFGIAPGKIVVLPNGANPKTFHPETSSDSIRKQLGFEGCLVLGFVGILRPWHGVDMLIDAFADLLKSHPDLRLLIVGDGPIQDEMETKSAQLGVRSFVKFTGRVPHARMAEYVAAMDVAVSPRATFYASPMKILEYMAMSKPVVAPDMPNIRDIIDDGRTGMLFEPESVLSLRNQMGMLIDNPPLRESIGIAARAKIEAQLNWKQNAERVVDVGMSLVRA